MENAPVGFSKKEIENTEEKIKYKKGPRYNSKMFFFCDKKTGRVENIGFARYIALARQQLGEDILDKCFPWFFDLTTETKNKEKFESRFCVFCEIVRNSNFEKGVLSAMEINQKKIETVLKDFFSGMRNN